MHIFGQMLIVEKQNKTHLTLCWCNVGYSGEYACDVTLSYYSKGRRFDSHRGQAYLSSLPGVDIHSE
jgi:hypothetical protein